MTRIAANHRPTLHVKTLITVLASGLIGAALALGVAGVVQWAPWDSSDALIDRLATCDRLYKPGETLGVCAVAARQDIEQWHCYEKYPEGAAARVECIMQVNRSRTPR